MRRRERAAGRESRGTVLVVDDHDEVRETIAMVVRSLGYDTIEAASAAEAVDRAVETAPGILVCDLGLGEGPDGVAVATVLRQRLPGLAVVLMSGFASSQLDLAAAPPGTQFLGKPMRLEALDHAIDAAVAAVGAAAAGPQPDIR